MSTLTRAAAAPNAKRSGARPSRNAACGVNGTPHNMKSRWSRASVPRTRKRSQIICRRTSCAFAPELNHAVAMQLTLHDGLAHLPVLCDLTIHQPEDVDDR